MPIPIVTGEALYTKEQFFECLARRAADILNPDICAIGGISALMDISTMAQPQAVVMSPHNYNTPLVGLAATVHVSRGDPELQDHRVFRQFLPTAAARSPPQSLSVSEGWIDLPTAPGLGIDIDIEKLRAYPHREASHHGLRQYTDEYPRKGYEPSLRDEQVSP